SVRTVARAVAGLALASCTSFYALLRRLDSRGLDRRCKRLEVLLKDGLSRFLRQPAWHDPKFAQPVGNLWQLRKSAHLAPDRCNDRLRRPGRCKESIPGRELKSRQRLSDR